MSMHMFIHMHFTGANVNAKNKQTLRQPKEEGMEGNQKNE